MADQRYIPAAGWRLLTPLFDPVMAVTTRERHWRTKVVDAALAPGPATILDIGCGTGTLAVQLARRAPHSRVIGLDGDPDILTRAAAKAQAAGVNVELLCGMADAIALDDASVDCAVSTLVFHHLAPDTKGRALAEIRRVLRPGGRLVIADYGGPHDPVMRVAFLYVQLLDGFHSTRQHAAGQLPDLIAEAGFSITMLGRLRTISGTIELLAATPSERSGTRQMPTPARAVS
jgi:ubiquinone/menaquinone biosynthesis C-methylase UbiE